MIVNLFYKISKLLLALVAVLFGVSLGAVAHAQVAAVPFSDSPAPHGEVLTSAAVQAELELRLARNPNNEASLWNVGYDFFRNYPRNQTTALAIHNGFLNARTGTPEQREIMLKAAIYWEKIHAHGITNVPVGQDFQTRQKIYYGSQKKFTTMPQRSSGSSHQKFNDYERPGSRLNQRQPYQGTDTNPYPGKYYPGMYPP